MIGEMPPTPQTRRAPPGAALMPTKTEGEVGLEANRREHHWRLSPPPSDPIGADAVESSKPTVEAPIL